MVRAYLNVRATGGAVFFPLRGENTRERWSPFKVEGDGGCSKKKSFFEKKGMFENLSHFTSQISSTNALVVMNDFSATVSQK